MAENGSGSGDEATLSGKTGSDVVGRRPLILAAAISGAGHVVHNLAEFPAAIVIAPETLVPLAITAVVLWGLLRRPGRAAFLLAGGWAVIVLLGGGLSVLPLAVWPFVPEQTLGHYLAHAVYAATQLPLLWVAVRGLRGTW